MKKKLLRGCGIAALVLLSAYLLTAAFFYERMMPGTYVNGIDVSLISRSEVERFMNAHSVSDYCLTVTDIHGADTAIKAEDIDLREQYHTETLAWQNPLLFPLYMWTGSSMTVPYDIVFDAEKLTALVQEKLLTPGDAGYTAPRNAYVSDYIYGSGYIMVPPEDGDTPIPEKVQAAVKDAVYAESAALNLQEADCYEKAEIREDDPELLQLLAKKQSEVSAVITYQFGSETRVVNSDTYYPWLTVHEDGTKELDKAAVRAYVDALKAETDTAGTTRNFVTADGRTVQVTGPFGYKMSAKKETEQLMADILSGEQITREPVYTRVGVQRDAPEYGSSYVEVDLTKQKVYLFVDGQQILETDCVTGNARRRMNTPEGIYSMTYKTKNATLRGPGYATHVNYWMPFNKGIGLHDATWRSKFGGEIYARSGSHGCVNLPLEAAKTIYEYVGKGFPVICHA